MRAAARDSCRDVFNVALEARCDAPPVFEAAEHALDDISLPVDGLIVVISDLAVFSRQDDGPGPAPFKPFAQFPTVTAFVGDRFGGWRHGLDAALCDLAIMHVSGRREQDAIDKNMGRPLWSRTVWSPVLRPPSVRPIPWGMGAWGPRPPFSAAGAADEP